MKTVVVMLTDNNGSYYGKYVVESSFVDSYILHKIRDIILSNYKDYNTFLEEFSSNIITVAKMVDKELKKENELASCHFEYEDEYTINVDEIYK